MKHASTQRGTAKKSKLLPTIPHNPNETGQNITFQLLASEIPQARGLEHVGADDGPVNPPADGHKYEIEREPRQQHDASNGGGSNRAGGGVHGGHYSAAARGQPQAAMSGNQ